jgi:hypothetical protein
MAEGNVELGFIQEQLKRVLEGQAALHERLGALPTILTRLERIERQMAVVVKVAQASAAEREANRLIYEAFGDVRGLLAEHERRLEALERRAGGEG